MRKKSKHMRVTINPVLDMETLKWVSSSGSYEYVGPKLDFCSGSSQIQSDEENLMQSQASLASTLASNYSAAFSEQQQVLAQQNARLSSIVANPMGYSPQELAEATTSINENAAQGARQAIGAASAYAAEHGGAADVGGGGAAQLAGEIGASAAAQKASSLANLSVANQQMKRQNLWSALSGLNQVGSAYGSAAGTAIGNEGGVANAGTNAGNLALQAGQTGIEDIGSLLSGIGGLAEAGVGAYGLSQK